MEQVQRAEVEAAVVCRSVATADLVATMLAAHGIPALAQSTSVYPSLDWVEGREVAVAASDLDRARELLAVLAGERDDVRVVEDGPSPTHLRD